MKRFHGMNSLISIIIKIILYFPLHLIRYLVSFKKRDKNLWVFGAWNGSAFADNSKYLFLYLNNFPSEIESVWITSSKKVVEELSVLGLPVFYLYSYNGLMACLNAGKQFTTHSLYDISPLLTKGSTHYCLFHASFPIKRMEFDILRNTMKKRLALSINKPFVFEKADYSVCSSSSTNIVISSALSIDKKHVLKTGFPRSDALRNNNFLSRDIERFNNICNFNQYDNLIYFIPTFRDDPDFNWFGFKFSEYEIGDLLEKTNSILLFRFHPFEWNKIKNQNKINHPRIKFEDHGISDPYPLLSKASILITDYSSIFSDFLIFDRPIIFANFDHQNYIKNERALYWDYDEVTPGPKVSNWSELKDELNNILIHEEDLHGHQRSNISSMIYDYSDSRASERIINLIARN